MLPRENDHAPGVGSGEARREVRTLLVSVIGALILGLGATILSAVTFYPNSFADGVDVAAGDGSCDSDPAAGVTVCTLRAAVMEANALAGLDTIELSSGTYILTLAGSGEGAGDLDVLDDLRILGVPGTEIDGNGISRVFYANLATLEIEGLTLRNGSISTGGCLWSNDDFTLRDVEIAGCEASGSGGALYAAGNSEVLIERAWIHGNNAVTGGGITISANVDLVLVDTTISANHATASDGGGILNFGHLFVNNSTIVGNTTVGAGGGIRSYGAVYLASSTVVGNWCDIDIDEVGTGCGIMIVSGSSEVRNSIIAENLNWGAIPITEPDDCDGVFVSHGYNLIGHPGALCSGFSAAGNDLVGAPTLDPQLRSLVNNGGPTPTMLPDVGSPVADGGNPGGCLGNLSGDIADPPTLLDHEQRGGPRALDDDSNGVARCDIGAVESALFADGFETGDVSNWSTSAP